MILVVVELAIYNHLFRQFGYIQISVSKNVTDSPHHYVTKLEFMGILFPVHPDLP